jgi:3-oxoacyl-[acyl-carrier protein] reductase
MELGLKDRSTVVLASTSGLGLACARALHAEGARVAMSGRDARRLEAALAALGGPGPRLFGATLDVTDGEALRVHLEEAVRRHGPIEILVTNSGGPPAATAVEVREEDLERAWQLTFRSAVRAIQHVLPGMRRAGWGRIVALTSSSVRVPIPGLVTSNALRAGLTGYLKTLAGEVAADGVLVNSVCMGAFGTERLAELFEVMAARNGTTAAAEREAYVARIPLGRVGEPRELGDLVAFLCSERCSFLSGVALAYDGGAGPGLL